MTSARQRFRAGALASLASHVVGAGGQILLVPAFLAAWGAQLYGEWLTLAAAVSYAAFADLGFSTYVVNRLNACKARDEMEEYARVLHSALAFSLKVSLVVFVALAAGAALVPFERVFAFEATPRATAALVAALLALQVTCTIPRGLVFGLYRTIGEYARGTNLANVLRVLHVGVSLVALALGGGLLAVAAAQLAPVALTIAWALRDLRRRHPELPLGLGERVPGLARTFLGPSLLFLAIQASLIGVLQGSTLIVGALFGAGSVAVFVSLRTLANFVRQAGGSLSNAVWPELTRLAAQGSVDVLRAVHRLKVKLLWAITLGAAAFLQLAGEDVFTTWTGGKLAFDEALFDAFLVLLVVQAPWTASSYVLLASNRHAALARRQGLAAALGLAVGGLAAAAWGLPAFLYGLCAAELVLCGLAVPAIVCREIGDPFGAFLADVFGRGLVVTLAVVGAVVLFDRWIGDPGVAARIGLAALAAGGTVIGLTLTLWLRSEERERLAGVLLPRLRTAEARR